MTMVEIVGRQPIFSDKIFEELKLIGDTHNDIALWVLDACAYGYIMGKREERARRKKRKQSA